MRSIQIVLACAMLLNILAILPTEVEGDALLEDAMWMGVDISCLDADEEPTDLLSDGTYLYISTADVISPYEASIYRYTEADGCEDWQDTDGYYIYSSYEYSVTGDLYWGVRASTLSLAGDIWTWDGATFSKIARTTWYHALTTDAGWPQIFHEFSGNLYVAGSGCDVNCDAFNINIGEGWAKYYDGAWNWINMAFNSPIVDDVLAIEDYGTIIYAGTYDYANILRFYPGNKTFWLDYKYVDGPVVSGQGVYQLIEYDGCLQGFTFKMGYNLTLCDSAQTWLSTDRTSTDHFARGIEFRGKVYLGWEDESTHYIGTFYNDTEPAFETIFTDSGSDYFLYWAEYDGTLWTTKGNNLYKRNTADPPLAEITSPNQGESVSKYMNFAAYVNIGSKTVQDIYFTLHSIEYTPVKQSGTYNWVYTDYDTKGLKNDKHTLYLTVLWTDGTYSKDTVDFFVLNKPGNRLDCIVQDNGNLICPDNMPYKPKWGKTRAEDVMLVDPYVHIQFDVIDTPSNAASVNLYLPYKTGEGSATILKDELHVSGINSTDRVWLNDTTPVAISNGLGFIYYNLMGAGNSNYTVESECVMTVTRVSTVRMIREFNWSGDPTTGQWNMEYFTFTNEIDSSNTIRNLWFYWSKAPDTTIDQEAIEVWDNTNNQELDIARHYSVDYGGFQLEVPSLSYTSSRSFTIQYYEEFKDKFYQQVINIYDSDIVMEGGFSSSPWHVEKKITMTVKDFDGMVAFVFKCTSPVKDKPLNPKSIIVEKDESIIDEWIYLDHTNQILLFDQVIDARTSTTYDIYFDFHEPEDLALNVMIDNHLAFIILGVVMMGMSMKPIFNEDEEAWYRYIMGGAFGAGMIIIVLVGILML